MRAAGFVLVGGRSARMGRDKALLPWNSQPLVLEIAARIVAAAGNVALVGSPERYRGLGLDCLPDLHPGLGPLAGIETALKSERGEYNLIVACDMPNLAVSHLALLLDECSRTKASCVVTRDDAGRIHPLCAVYRSTGLPVVRRAVAEHRLKLMDLIRELDATIVNTCGQLDNINTPDDWRTLTTIEHCTHGE